MSSDLDRDRNSALAEDSGGGHARRSFIDRKGAGGARPALRASGRLHASASSPRIRRASPSALPAAFITRRERYRRAYHSGQLVEHLHEAGHVHRQPADDLRPLLGVASSPRWKSDSRSTSGRPAENSAAHSPCRKTACGRSPASSLKRATTSLPAV